MLLLLSWNFAYRIYGPFFNRHQLADAVLKITFSVSKIVGNVSYQINLAKYRISPNVAGLRRTSPDISADVTGVNQLIVKKPDLAGRRRTSPDVARRF